MGPPLQQGMPAHSPGPFVDIVYEWFATTWTSGDFWRNLLVAFLGIFLPAAVGWWWTKRNEKSERERKRKFLYEVLFNGLIRNLIVLRRIRTDIEEYQRSPETRLHTGHYDTIVMTAVEVLEDHPEEYGMLVNAHVCVDHLNRRLDQVLDVERLNMQAAQTSSRGARIQFELEPYIGQLVGRGEEEGHIAKLERMLVSSLEFLDKPRLEEEIRKSEIPLASSAAAS